MNFGDGASRDRLKASSPTGSSRLGTAVTGLAVAVMAKPAVAQQPAEPAPLPPLEVTTAKKKAKAKPVAQKKAPAPKQTTVPAQSPPPTEAPSETAAGFGDGSGTTPATGNTLQSGTGIGRLPGTLQDTPQTVNTISQEQIKQQNINQLDQALRNVPGVTANVGEGGGGMNGDQFRIRGFQSKGDIYVDGLRDFGVYVRDSFAYEQVDVIKGPSSESFGMGTTGGVINIQQKKAHLGDSNYVEGSIGTDSFYRTMIDINKQLTNTIAARAVTLYHDQEFADRDHLYSERFGFLGSIAFGLGTDTEWTVNYLHQNGERMPDFGVPFADADGAAFPGAVGSRVGRPVTEYGVDRSNYYGKSTDIDDYSVDMLTSRLTHKVNKNLTFFNDTRLAFYDRYFAQTVTSCGNNAAAGFCAQGVESGNFDVPYQFGGPAGFDQEASGIQNITTAVAKFKTGAFRHEAVVGIDLFYQEDNRTNLANYNADGEIVINAPISGQPAPDPDRLKGFPGTIGNPNFTPNYRTGKNPLALKEAEADNVALFASDRVWLTKEFSLLGGVRWDRYRASYRATDSQTGLWTGSTGANTYSSATSAEDIDTESEFTSPKASVIWEPSANQSYYASWAKSYSPVGQFITNDNASVAGGGQENRDPEENELWEVGAKVSTPDGRLGFTAALFRVEKGNASYADLDGNTLLSGEEQRVQGLELGVTGSVTKAWTLQAAYAYLDSEILKSTATLPTPANPPGTPDVAQRAYIEGNDVPFVPEHSISLWSTYELSKHIPTSGKWLVGGGVIWTDEYFTNSLNFAYVPANFTFDAMTSYEIDGWRFAVNGYNLTDELNYDSAIGGRAVVSPGRSGIVTVGKRF